jgi:hypothetical protein
MEEYKNCPYCAEKVLLEAILCKHCGKKFKGKSPSKKYLKIILYIFLFIVFLGNGYWVWQLTEKNQQLDLERQALIISFDDLELEKNNLSQDYKNLVVLYDDLLFDLEIIEIRNEDLRDQISSQRERIQGLEEVETLVMCDSRIYDVNINSNSAAAQSIKDWANDHLGEIVRNTWDTIWSNNTSAIHYLYTDEYMYPFIVFSNQHGRTGGVFSLTDRCWLYVED